MENPRIIIQAKDAIFLLPKPVFEKISQFYIDGPLIQTPFDLSIERIETKDGIEYQITKIKRR